VIPALGITARIAIKPIVEAILRLRDGGVLPGDSAAALGGDVRQLRAELQNVHDELALMRADVARLREAESFHLALGDGAPAALPKAEPAAQNS
jgi:hypothetical protein